MAMEQNNSNQPRRRFTGEEKFKIVKEQVTTKTSVSEICKKYGIYPSQFYGWLEQFFDGARAGFEKKLKQDLLSAAEQRELIELRGETNRMKTVIAEITAENIAYKKKNLGLDQRR
jgi:transposase-like protein